MQAVYMTHDSKSQPQTGEIEHEFGVSHAATGERIDVRFGSRVLRGLVVGLPGQHQHDNAACAVAAMCPIWDP